MATDNCKIASYTHNDIIISDRNWFVPVFEWDEARKTRFEPNKRD